MKKIILFIVACLVLIGCAGTKKMTPTIKNRLKKIKIENKVTMPKEVFFMTKGDALSIGFGGIIGSLFSGSDISQEEQLRNFLQNNNIYFDEMIKKEYALALKSKPYYYNRLTSNEDADEKFRIKVNMYGLVYHHSIFSSDYKPTANVKFELIDKQGHILWSAEDFITSYADETPSMPLKEYFTNPNNLRKALQSTAKIIANLVVKTLP